ncbi:MAG TPA: B12-binding domain-containing radical SAM protein, partial [Azonexus sp.]|nr:B12-binding domain-containing radical SAM protein [Azonexus sp.]
VDADTMQRFARFARYWDLLANSGRFRQTLPLLLEAAEPGRAPSPFQAFLDFADWLWQTTGLTSGLSPEALVDALFDYLGNYLGLPAQALTAALLADYVASGARGSPQVLRGRLPPRAASKQSERQLVHRQAQHRA